MLAESWRANLFGKNDEDHRALLVQGAVSR